MYKTKDLGLVAALMVVITKNEHIKIHRDDLSKGKLIKVGYLE